MSGPCPIPKERIDEFKSFIDICKINPEILNIPQLSFFKNFIESLGGKVPSTKMPTKESMPKKTEEPKVEEVESEPESDLELDMQGCIEPDTIDENQKMGDPNKEVSTEDEDNCDKHRSEAMSEFSQGNFEKAIELFTKAMEFNPNVTALFVKRGQSYLKLNKPNACIKDCSRALELNPDSASAFKFRGRAYRLLGEWVNAHKDLVQACKIDFDEQTNEWLKEVEPNAKKIMIHNLKQEHKKQEKIEREKKERFRKMQEAHASASKQAEQPGDTAGSEPAGGPRAAEDFYKLLEDPDIMEAFKDPEVAKAFQDISTNPANFIKYSSNEKITKLIAKISSKMSNSGMNFQGFPSAGFQGFPGGFPNFGGAGADPSQRPQEDDNLD